MINVTIYKVRDVWWMQYRFEGKRIRRSLSTKIESVARRKAISFQKRLLTEQEGCTSEKKLLQDFWKEYLPISEEMKRPKTVDNDKRIWKAFSQWLESVGIRHLSKITSAIFERYRSRLLAGGMKKTSVNIIHRHLSSILSTAVKMSCLDFNPLKKVSKYKVSQGIPKFMSKDEIEKVLDEAEKTGQKTHIIFALGLYAGFRKSEIANARWEWFDFENCVIVIQPFSDFVPKSHRTRPIPMHHTLKKILEMYRKEEGYLLDGGSPRKPEEDCLNLLRTDFRRGFESVVRRAGLPWVTPHILRHTFASQLAKAGVSLYKIQQWLGHSDPRTTMIYAHLQAQDDEINKI